MATTRPNPLYFKVILSTAAFPPLRSRRQERSADGAAVVRLRRLGRRGSALPQGADVFRPSSSDDSFGRRRRVSRPPQKTIETDDVRARRDGARRRRRVRDGPQLQREGVQLGRSLRRLHRLLPRRGPRDLRRDEAGTVRAPALQQRARASKARLQDFFVFCFCNRLSLIRSPVSIVLDEFVEHEQKLLFYTRSLVQIRAVR